MARPIQFNRTEVIRSAMTLFWQHGYAATSMLALLATTGLKSGSLYASFGSKQGLFETAIDFYASTSLKALNEELNATDDFVTNIRTAIFATIDGGLGGEPLGCFLINSLVELAPHDPAIKQRVQGHLGNVEQAFVSALENAKMAGQLSEGFNTEQKAKKIMITIWGIRVSQRTSLSHQQVDALKKLYEKII